MENEILLKAEEGLNNPSVSASLDIYDAIMNKVERGDIEPLLALAQLKCISDAIDKASKYIREVSAVEAMNAESTQTAKYYGCKFTIKEVGTKYDYSGDDEWDTLKAEADQIKARMKAREVILQSEGKFIKTSTTSVSVTLV